MVSIRRFWLLSIAIVLPVLVVACGEEGGSGVLEPEADEPMVLESVMCLDIDEGRPIGIVSSFLDSDERIYVWIYWVNVEGEHTAKTVWFEGDAILPFEEESQTFDSSTGFSVTWFFIAEPSDGFSKGEWSVEIYMDGLFERSYLFTVD